MSEMMNLEYPTNCTSKCSNNPNLPPEPFAHFCPTCYDAIMKLHQPRLRARPLALSESDSDVEVNVDLILGLHAKAPRGLGMVEAVSPAPVHRTATAKKCGKCQKRVGLAGFQCRCEGHYCSEHRHAEKHECTFDYRTYEREELSRQNPLVVGQKVIHL